MGFLVLSWNCEGLKSSIHNLIHILNTGNYAFASLSETQLFQCDIPQISYLLGDTYAFFLNSDDLYDPSLPLEQNRSFGDTKFLWRRDLDPYIEIQKPTSPSFIVALFKYPGFTTSVHFTLYLPTQGKDFQFFTAFAGLRNALDDLMNNMNCPVFYLRGDGNINPKNKQRAILLQKLCHDYHLNKVELDHPTYHHFMGNGLFDSSIDILLHTVGVAAGEEVIDIICKKDNPMNLSHHDMIISKFIGTASPAPYQEELPLDSSVPQVNRQRLHIFWKDEGIASYEAVVGSHLSRLRNDWSDSSNSLNMSILLSLTNDILNIAAKNTNRSKCIEMYHHLVLKGGLSLAQ